MSQHDFPMEEFAARRASLLAELASREMAWFLAFHPTSIHWLVGSQAKSYQAFQCLLVDARKGRFVLFTREAERNECQDEALVDDLVCWGRSGEGDPIGRFLDLAKSLGLFQTERVGMEVPAYYLHPHHYVRVKAAFELTPLVECNEVVHDIRIVKSPREIVCIREAARIADLSAAAFKQALGAGQTEQELASIIYRTALENAADVPTVPINLVCGRRAAYSHGAPTAHRLAEGETGNVEFCIPFRRHNVSIGRQFSIGEPSARVQTLHALVRDAADACIGQIRNGASARAPHVAASNVIDAAGFSEHLVHTLGYAIAPAFPPATGEHLQLSTSSDYVLKTGMLLSVCPNIFIGRERVGVRIVDNVLVTEKGAEVLSAVPRDLMVGK